MQSRIATLELDLPPDITVHQVDVANHAESAFEHAKLTSFLSDAEKQRAERFLRPSIRSRFIYARTALRFLLGARLQKQPAELAIETDAAGRPYMAMPNNGEIDFNLTHSGDIALIAIGPKRYRLGVDIERQKKMRDINQLAKRVLNPSELTALEAAQPYDLDMFFRFWTLKEAYLKALGTGLQVDMKKLELNLSANNGHRFRHLPDRSPSFSIEFAPAAGYRAALVLLAATT